MQKLGLRVVLCSATLFLAGGSAHSQILDNFGGSTTVESMTIAPAPLPEFKWDYRFDAQYNSTIKPYLRWHRRQENSPPTGVRYPYYHGPQPYYGPSYGGDCSACGGAPSYIQGYVQPRRSSWFNPYSNLNQGLYHGGVPGDSHGVLRYLSEKSTPANSPVIEVKTAWIKHEQVTDGISVLYNSPADESRDQFYEAKVTTRDGKLTKIDWVDSPTETLTTIVAKYRP